MAQGNDFDYRAFIAAKGGSLSKYPSKKTIYQQGDIADAFFYIVSGQIKVSVNSYLGKEAVIAVYDAGEFFGESSLTAHQIRTVSVATTVDSEIVRLDRSVVDRAIIDDPTFARIFVRFLLDRNESLKESFIDQLFNSSEKRLARILLTLANGGEDEHANVIPVPISQEMLANMVGTTRSRINQFMNKFRKLGYVEYDGHIKEHDGHIKVHSLLSVILHDASQSDAI